MRTLTWPTPRFETGLTIWSFSRGFARVTQIKAKMTLQEHLPLPQARHRRVCLRAGSPRLRTCATWKPALAELAQSPLRGISTGKCSAWSRDMADASWNELQKRYPLLKERTQAERLQY